MRTLDDEELIFTLQTPQNELHIISVFCFSDENDSIFVYLTDHGNKGIFHFPNSTVISVHHLLSCLCVGFRALTVTLLCLCFDFTEADYQ